MVLCEWCAWKHANVKCIFNVYHCQWIYLQWQLSCFLTVTVNTNWINWSEIMHYNTVQALAVLTRTHCMSEICMSQCGCMNSNTQVSSTCPPPSSSPPPSPCPPPLPLLPLPLTPPPPSSPPLPTADSELHWRETGHSRIYLYNLNKQVLYFTQPGKLICL